MVAQVDFCHRFAEIANVWWEHEPRIATQLDGSLINEFEAQQCDRNCACGSVEKSQSHTQNANN